MDIKEIKKLIEEAREDFDSLHSSVNNLEEAWRELLRYEEKLNASDFEEMVKAGFTIGSRWHVGNDIWKVTAYHPLGCKFINESKPENDCCMKADRLMQGFKEKKIILEVAN